MLIYMRKGVTDSNGSPWLKVTIYQKSNLTLVGAVAFLMLFVCFSGHLAKGELLTVQATPIVIVSELLKKLTGLQIIIIRWKRKYKRKNIKRLQRHWIKQKIHIQIDFSSRKCYYFNDGAIMAKIFYREGAERHACSGSTMIKQRSGWENE